MFSIKQLYDNNNYRAATIIFIVLVAWIASGLIKQTAAADKNRQAPEQPLYSVRALPIIAQSYHPVMRVSARTAVNRSVDIRAEVAGQVARLPVKKGDAVKQGELICELAIEDRALRVTQAEAEVSKAELDYNAALQLKSSGFQARTVIAEKLYLLETARANLESNRIQLAKTQIKAPFNGFVEERQVEMGDLMQPGDRCATVVDINPLLVVGQITATTIKSIKTRDTVNIELLTGEKLTGTIRFIANQANNLTRTYTLEVAIDNPLSLLRSGMTAEIVFNRPAVNAHLITPSLLSLDDLGNTGLRIVNDQSQVEFITVKLIGDDENGVWVTGLPEKVLLITVGQEYVSNGQTVHVDQNSSPSTASTPTL